MKNFNCIHCGSSNIKLVKSIFESETEAQYKYQSDFTKVPSTKEMLEKNDNIAITSQTALANKLSNINLKNKENFKEFIDFEKYQGKYNMFKEEIEKQKDISLETSDLDWKKSSLIFIVTILFLTINIILNQISPLLQTLWGMIFFGIIIFFIVDFIYLLSYVDLKIQQKKNPQKYKSCKKILYPIRNFEEKIKSKSKTIKKIREKYEKQIEKELSKMKERENQIQQIKQEIYEIEKEAKEQLEKVNQNKFNIWSNLYYCYDCDHVMDLEKKLYQEAQYIYDLVDPLEKD